MPQQFTYKDNETGRTVTFNQDTEPTEEQIAAKFEAEAPAASDQAQPAGGLRSSAAAAPLAAPSAAPAAAPAPVPFKVMSDDEILDGAKRLRELGKEGPEVEAFIAKARKEQRDYENRLLDEGDLSKVGQLADAAETVAKATARAGAEGAIIGMAASMGQAQGARIPGMLRLPGIVGGGALTGMAADYAIQAAESVGTGQPFRYDIPRGLGTGIMSGVPGLPALASVSPMMQAARQNVPAITRTLEYFLSRHPAEVAKNVMGAVGGAQVEKMARGEGPLTGEELAKATGIGYAGGRMGVAARSSKARQTIADEMADEAVANVRRREWMENDGLVNPSTSNRDSIANKALTTVAGTRAEDVIAIKNQRVTDKLARQDMRFPRAADGSQLPLSDENYNNYKNELAKPLNAIESLGGNFPALVDTYKLARDAAKKAWAEWRAAKNDPQQKGSTAPLLEAQKLQAVADAAGNALETNLVAQNQKSLAQEWRASNKLFAKMYANWGATLDGHIDASVLADMHGTGQVKNLSGYQKLIAEMAQGDASVMRHPSVVKGEKLNVSPAAASFVAALSAMPGGLLGLSKGLGTAAAGAGGGLAIGGVVGGLAGPPMARALLSSPTYQRTMGFAIPDYYRPATAPNVARMGTEFMMSSPSMAPATSILQFQQ